MRPVQEHCTPMQVFRMPHPSIASRVPPGPGGGKPPRHWVIVKGAFSRDECERLCAAFSAFDAREGGLVAGRFDQKVRQSGLVWLPEGEAFDWVAQRMARMAGDANRDAFRYALDGFVEQLQVASYGPGHYYDWHMDRGHGAVAGRRGGCVGHDRTFPDRTCSGCLARRAGQQWLTRRAGGDNGQPASAAAAAGRRPWDRAG